MSIEQRDKSSVNTSVQALESLVDHYYYNIVEPNSKQTKIEPTAINREDSLDNLNSLFDTVNTGAAMIYEGDKTLTSTPVDKYKQKTIDKMLMVNSDKKDYQKAKKRKTRSPISMIDLDKIQEDESVSESESATSDSEALCPTSETWHLRSSTVQLQSVIESMKKTFHDQFSEFKDDISKVITKSQQEDKELLSTLVAKVESLSDQLSKKDDEIKQLQVSLDNSQLRSQLLEGRLTRIEKQMFDMHEDLLQEKARSMKPNLIFHNIDETQNENTLHVLQNFLKTELHMKEDNIKNIPIDRVHRMGMRNKTGKRPIIAHFASLGDRINILRHTKHLTQSKKFYVATQLPPELNERKKKLWPQFKQAKEQNRSVKWVGEKLLLDNKLIQAKKDTVSTDVADVEETIASTRYRNIPPVTFQGSQFQGHITAVKDPKDVASKLQVLYMDTRVARATHNIYAYRVSDETGITEHYEDDGEWSAGKRMLRILKELNVVNKLVVVSRWYGGQHLGPKRFQYVEDATREVCKIKN